MDDINSMFNTMFVAVGEFNDDIKKTMLNIMITFTAPQLQASNA